jgi:hypothetical protein
MKDRRKMSTILDPNDEKKWAEGLQKLEHQGPTTALFDTWEQMNPKPTLAVKEIDGRPPSRSG